MKIIALLTAGIVAGLSAAPASSMPLPDRGIETTGNVITVADGCGRGWFRGRDGRCYPDRRGPPPRGYRPGWGPPPPPPPGWGPPPPRWGGPPPPPPPRWDRPPPPPPWDRPPPRYRY